MSVLVLAVDDEPDVAELFRQQFRRDLRAQRFVLDFAISAVDAPARDQRAMSGLDAGVDMGCTSPDAAVDPVQTSRL